MTVDTTIVGSTDSQSFRLKMAANVGPNPAVHAFTVYWGDGNSDFITSYNQPELTHTYSSAGVYQIELHGHFDGLRYVNTNDGKKVLSIDQWGTNVWKIMDYSFDGFYNMVGNYTDAPDTSQVESFINCFRSCELFNSPIEFDMSSALRMDSMFHNCKAFNQPVSHWDTSNVTSMYQLFGLNLAFQQPIKFDMTSVTDIGSMFLRSNYNQPINWNVPALESVVSMFYLSTFNSPITLNTTTNLTSLNSMFRKNSVFNNTLVISETSAVTNMGRMFDEAIAFDQDISWLNPSSLCSIINCGGGSWFMLASIPWSTVNYDLLLVAWDAYGTSDNRLTAGTAKYSAGAPATARANMISRGWQFFDGGQA